MVNVSSVDPGFESISGEGSYASFKIKGVSRADYELRSHYGSIRVPDQAKNSYELHDDNEEHYKGKIGGGGGQIELSTSYGDIYIKTY